jgi:hypothetical protein
MEGVKASVRAFFIWRLHPTLDVFRWRALLEGERWRPNLAKGPAGD